MKSLLVIAIATLACTVTSMAQNIPSYIPTDGLVGWWPFNGNANDESGNGNIGIVNGATLTSDRFGSSDGAYMFDGNSQYISCPAFSSVNPSFITVSIWFNASSLGPSENYIINKSLDQNPGSVNRNWGIRINGTTGLIAFEIRVNNLYYYFTSNTTINPIEWNHLVFSFDGTYANTYNNGVIAISESITGTMSASNYPLSIGYFPNQSIPPYGYFWNGSIDDIAIWNRALTPQEISDLYTTSSTNNNETANTTTNVPGAISYQAVARDAQGAPLADTNVQVRFTLIADSLSGSEEYVETHTLSTNSLGLFTTAFGAGTPVSNTFENINWSAGNKFLNVQVDTGNGLVDMGTQQLLSTPYSLYSAKAGEIKNPGLPVFSDNAAALAGGLVAGDMYRTAAGVLMVVH